MIQGLYYLRQGGYVFSRVFLLICWFVTRITKKLLNGFPRDLDRGCDPAQNRPHSFLVRIQIKGRRTPLSAALVVDALKCKQQIQEKQLAKCIILRQACKLISGLLSAPISWRHLGSDSKSETPLSSMTLTQHLTLSRPSGSARRPVEQNCGCVGQLPGVNVCEYNLPSPCLPL